MIEREDQLIFIGILEKEDRGLLWGLKKVTKLGWEDCGLRKRGVRIVKERTVECGKFRKERRRGREEETGKGGDGERRSVEEEEKRRGGEEERRKTKGE